MARTNFRSLGVLGVRCLLYGESQIHPSCSVRLRREHGMAVWGAEIAGPATSLVVVTVKQKCQTTDRV